MRDLVLRFAKLICIQKLLINSWMVSVYCITLITVLFLACVYRLEEEQREKDWLNQQKGIYAKSTKPRVLYSESDQEWQILNKKVAIAN